MKPARYLSLEWFEPQTDPAALALLRFLPEIFYTNHGLLMDIKCTALNTGSPCKLSMRRISPHVFALVAEDGAGDWYYPYKRNTAPYVDVPKNLDSGTMVVTGPMNGCALAVFENERCLRFYHDSDGTSLGLNYNDPHCKLRIESENYEVTYPDIMKTTEDIMIKHRHRVGSYFSFSIVAIKRRSWWYVFASGVVEMINGSERTAIPYIGHPYLNLVGKFQE